MQRHDHGEVTAVEGSVRQPCRALGGRLERPARAVSVARALRRDTQQVPNEALVRVVGAALAERFGPQQCDLEVAARGLMIARVQRVQRGADMGEFVEVVALAGVFRGEDMRLRQNLDRVEEATQVEERPHM